MHLLKRDDQGDPGPLAIKLANVLYEAGRQKATCIAYKSAPAVSFAEWTQRQIETALQLETTR